MDPVVLSIDELTLRIRMTGDLWTIHPTKKKLKEMNDPKMTQRYANRGKTQRKEIPIEEAARKEKRRLEDEEQAKKSKSLKPLILK